MRKKNYSFDDKEQCVLAVKKGMSKMDIVRRTGVSRTSLDKWCDEYDRGVLAPKKDYKINDDQVRQYMLDNGESQISEIAKKFEVCQPTVHGSKKRIGAFKKWAFRKPIVEGLDQQSLWEEFVTQLLSCPNISFHDEKQEFSFSAGGREYVITVNIVT